MGVYSQDPKHIRFLELTEEEVEILSVPTFGDRLDFDEPEIEAMPTEIHNRIHDAMEHNSGYIRWPKKTAKYWGGYLPQPGYIYTFDSYREQGKVTSMWCGSKSLTGKVGHYRVRFEITCKADLESAIIRGEAGAKKEDWRESLDLVRDKYHSSSGPAQAHLIAKVVQYISKHP